MEKEIQKKPIEMLSEPVVSNSTEPTSKMVKLEINGKVIDEVEFEVPNDLQPPGYITGTNFPRTRDKVAIVGFAPSSMTDVRCLFGDPEWEIWGLNQLYISFPAIVEHATRWWQIHHRHDYDRAVRDHKHHDWLAQQRRFPIYMQEQIGDIPLSVPLPFKDIVSAFPYGNYMTNSISWEIALAIMEGFKTIHVYGVDMAQDEEFFEQRPSCEYWAGIAVGRGIDFYIPTKSDLLKTAWMYPIETDSPMRIKIDSRRKELRQRVNETHAQKQAMNDQEMQLLGALENMNYIEKCWMVNVKEVRGANSQAGR